MLNYKNYGRLWRVYGRSVFLYFTPRKLLNAVRTELAYRRRQVDVATPPYILHIEPLYYCNLVCPLCDRQGFSEVRRDGTRRLPLEVLDKILDEIGDYLWQCHIFGLGEPLLDWPRTKQIIEKAHRRGIFTLVSTNCTLVTPEIAREIMESGLDHLVCAIDGITQESYGKYRVGGRVDAALANLRLLAEERDRRRSKIEIEWQYLVNKYNIGEMEEAKRLADEMGVFIRFAPMRGMEWNAELQEKWLPAADQWQDGRLAPGEAASDFHCSYLWRSLTVTSNGQLARCPIYYNVELYGDLRQDTPIMKNYNGASSQRARQLFQPGQVPEGDFPAPCATCAFFKREHGGQNCDKGWTLGKPPKPVKSFIALEELEREQSSVVTEATPNEPVKA